MSPEIALEYINAAKSTTYAVTNKLSGGENQGAFLVSEPTGKRAVLKLSANPMWRSQVERAKAATAHLATLGYPVPKYTYIDATNTGTFWLEDEMPGAAIEQATPEQITQLLGFIMLQKGQTISEVQGQDWSWYAGGVVFRGESGLVRVLMQFSETTSALAAQIEGMVLGLDGKALGRSDLVHGDLVMSQVLGANNQITAVLDWDQVGYGDVAMDLVSLWYSLMDNPPARDLVFAKLKEVSDPESIKIFAAYKMLAIIAWHINKVGGDVATVSAQATTALGLLRAL